MSTASPDKVHLHLVNDPRVAGNFHVTEDKVWRVLHQGVPDAASRLHVTIGRGEEGFHEAMRTAQVLVAFRFPHREIGQIAPRLRWIHEIGAGVDHLMPMDWLPDHVVLSNSSGVHLPKAGEFVTCALLMLNHLFPTHITNQRERRWVKVFSDYIGGKTLLIVGVGQIGGEAASRAKQLNLVVLGIRRSGGQHPHVDRMYRPDQLTQVLPEADFVLLSAPRIPETEGLIGAKEFDLMKPTAGLINIGRGALLDSDALAERLSDGRIRGAVLDVFETEPLPEASPLWACRNLIITPHVSLDALDYSDRMLTMLADNVQRFLTGLPVQNVVVASRGY